jgi:hypothetical protein
MTGIVNFVHGPVIKVSCFLGTQESRCLLHLLTKKTDPVSERFCFLLV